ncbi:hypothetical protein Sarmat_00792 [Rickettsiales endosymbiont of Paramecium tredecaurelia]|nr:hypothetical protein [Candidatus Sarmatiella mevalonica]
MFMFYNTTLRQMLSKHFRWNKSRVELLGMIILSLFKIKNHNRRLFSIFSYGLTFLRKILMQSKFIEIFDFFFRSIMSNNPLNSKLKQLCVRY